MEKHEVLVNGDYIVQLNDVLFKIENDDLASQALFAWYTTENCVTIERLLDTINSRETIATRLTLIIEIRVRSSQHMRWRHRMHISLHKQLFSSPFFVKMLSYNDEQQ